MSIIRLAARVALRQALLAGQTLAEDRVYDSAITEIDLAAVEERKPLLIVTTDDVEGEVVGRDILNSEPTLDIVVETACAAPAVLEDGAQTLVIPDTDAGYEVSLDIVCRQVIRVIQAGGGEWGDVFRDLVPSFTHHLQRRGADNRNGVKFAARQIVVTAKLLAEPLDPPEEDTPLGRFLTMAEDNPKLAPLVPIIRSQFGSGPQTSWDDLRTALGLSMGEYALMAVAPSFGPETPGFDIEGAPATGGEAALPPEDGP